MIIFTKQYTLFILTFSYYEFSSKIFIVGSSIYVCLQPLGQVNSLKVIFLLDSN